MTLTGKPRPGKGGFQSQLCWSGSASWSMGVMGEGESQGARKELWAVRGVSEGLGSGWGAVNNFFPMFPPQPLLLPPFHPGSSQLRGANLPSLRQSTPSPQL